MYSYEIRTFEPRWHSSLIMFAQCPNDVVAILIARGMTRKGQAIEVWHGDRLVYWVGLKPARSRKPDPVKRNKRATAGWAGWIMGARAES